MLQEKLNHSEANTFPAFGMRDKIGYMFGDLGNCFIVGLVNSFLMIYYTNVLGISGAVVGILFLVSRIIDAFADVTVGRLADITKVTKSGRFHPWISRARYFFSAIGILLFLPFVSSWPMTAKIVYIFISYVVYGIILSTINIPYGSMAAAITSDPDERVSLSTFRSVGSSIGGATTGFLVPILMYANNSQGRQVVSGTRFFAIAIGCAIIAFIAFTLTCKLTTERVRVEKKDIIPAKTLLKGLVTNKALISFVFVDFLAILSSITLSTSLTYLFNDYFQNKSAMSIALLFNYGTIIILSPFVTPLAKRFGKKETSTVALLSSAAMYVIIFFVHTHSPWLYLAMLFVATLGNGIFSLLIWAFITDVIDFQQYRTGLREDGTVYGINSFSRKVAQAFAGAIGGIILSIIGYQSSSNGGVIQSVAVQNKIYAVTSLMTAFFLIAAALVLWFTYPLNKKKTKEMQNGLAKINSSDL